MIKEYNGKISHHPQNELNPLPFPKQLRITNELLEDTMLWELDRFESNEKWATDPPTRHIIETLREKARIEEELDILANQALRFVNSHYNNLKKVKDKKKCRPRGLQTAKRARTPQQPPQQQVIHQSGLVLLSKTLLGNREMPKPHQRSPTTERKFFTRTPSSPPQPRRQPQTHSRKPNSSCSKPSNSYRRYMMPHAKQKPTKSRLNEPHSKKSPQHFNKCMSKSKQKHPHPRPHARSIKCEYPQYSSANQSQHHQSRSHANNQS